MYIFVLEDLVLSIDLHKSRTEEVFLLGSVVHLLVYFLFRRSPLTTLGGSFVIPVTLRVFVLYRRMCPLVLLTDLTEPRSSLNVISLLHSVSRSRQV